MDLTADQLRSQLREVEARENAKRFTIEKGPGDDSFTYIRDRAEQHQPIAILFGPNRARNAAVIVTAFEALHGGGHE